MTPLELLRALRALDVIITLIPYDDSINFNAPAGVLTEVLKEAIRAHKQALLDIAEWYDERASLLQYDAGLSRAEAEREAWKHVEERYGNVYG